MSSPHNIEMSKKDEVAIEATKSNTQDYVSLPRPPPESLRGLSPEELKKAERQLVRKLDSRLIAPLIIIYIMNYLDRNAIAAAKISGIEKDLGLTDSEYQTSVSILFVGSVSRSFHHALALNRTRYILMQVPSNLFLNKIGKPSLYLPGCMIAWVSDTTRKDFKY